jgi:hypothetical protein
MSVHRMNQFAHLMLAGGDSDAGVPEVALDLRRWAVFADYPSVQQSYFVPLFFNASLIGMRATLFLHIILANS